MEEILKSRCIKGNGFRLRRSPAYPIAFDTSAVSYCTLALMVDGMAPAAIKVAALMGEGKGLTAL